jgi:hypothetical protein
LCVLSRALERAIKAVPDKPRRDIATSDLAEAVEAAAREGIRDEKTLAQWALNSVGLEYELA